jgi:hypothetical protein
MFYDLIILDYYPQVQASHGPPGLILNMKSVLVSNFQPSTFLNFGDLQVCVKLGDLTMPPWHQDFSKTKTKKKVTENMTLNFISPGEKL